MVYYDVVIRLHGLDALTNFTPPQRDSPSPSPLPAVAETLAEVIAILDKLKNDKSQNKELLDSSPNEDDDDWDGEDPEEGIIYSVEKEESLRKRAWEESKKMWVVAGPTIFTRFSTFGIMVVSQSFIGHIGSTELATYAIVMSVLVRFANGALINEFVKLGGDQLVPYYADILGAILPCIADKEEKIRVVHLLRRCLHQHVLEGQHSKTMLTSARLRRSTFKDGAYINTVFER
ncbi:hypothetical protein JHK87_042532 [Glycine soja]|nr:hypothetical protein JHK87_042532 [Glycine soja]